MIAKNTTAELAMTEYDDDFEIEEGSEKAFYEDEFADAAYELTKAEWLAITAKRPKLMEPHDLYEETDATNMNETIKSANMLENFVIKPYYLGNDDAHTSYAWFEEDRLYFRGSAVSHVRMYYDFKYEDLKEREKLHEILKKS